MKREFGAKTAEGKNAYLISSQLIFQLSQSIMCEAMQRRRSTRTKITILKNIGIIVAVFIRNHNGDIVELAHDVKLALNDNQASR